MLFFIDSISNSINSAVIYKIMCAVGVCIYSIEELLINGRRSSWSQKETNSRTGWSISTSPLRKHGSHVEAKQLWKHRIHPQFVVNSDAFNAKVSWCRCWCPYHKITPGTASNMKLTLDLKIIRIVPLQ